MAHKVTYEYNGVAKEINFSYSEFRNMHEAVAHAEGIDLTKFLKMEQELQSITRDSMRQETIGMPSFLKWALLICTFIKMVASVNRCQNN